MHENGKLALLAQCNAAARAFVSGSWGLVSGHSELQTGKPPFASTCSQIKRRSA